MFSALFGSRGSSSGKLKRGKHASSPQPDSPPPPNPETLEAVIKTQKKRRRACARQAAKAEHRRDSLLHEAETCVQPVDIAALNERAAEAENLRKTKTAMVITLQAQIGVLERVLTESGMKGHNMEEDFDVAEERMDRDEDQLIYDQEDVRVQQENAEEMSLLLSRNIALPFDEDGDDGIEEELDDFEQGEAI